MDIEYEISIELSCFIFCQGNTRTPLQATSNFVAAASTFTTVIATIFTPITIVTTLVTIVVPFVATANVVARLAAAANVNSIAIEGNPNA